MDKFLNEELFEIILEKAFTEHEKEVLKSYPDDVELESKYPISKKEIRKFKNIAKEKEYGKKLIWVYLNRAAVVVLCVISLFCALIMTSSEVRAAVENVILKWYDKYTEFVFTETPSGFVSEKIEDVEIGYIPEGFELEFEEKLEKRRFLYYVNSANLNEDISVNIFYNADTASFFDNENLEYKKKLIDDHEIWVMYDDLKGVGSIVVIGSNITTNITGYLTETELIKIGRSIK
jgi:hypothetical protein